ncbi:MAG: DUF4864 domain-containing protein [Verrucomicrobiota bacterium]
MRGSFFPILSTFIMIFAYGEGLPPNELQMTAKDVVLTQLEALQTNDTPEADHGIGIAWKYAHPKNKESTGPLPRFTQMLYSPAYKPLLNHRSHTVTELENSRRGEATFEVIVVTGEGVRLKYFWLVERIDRDDEKSPWRTTAVSSPSPEGGNLV